MDPHPPTDIPPTFRFDRRRSPRRNQRGTAVCVFHRPNARPMITTVRLADASDGGLGVYVDTPISVGTTFSLYPDDDTRPRRIGRVVRAERLEKTTRLGLQFQQALAA